MSVRVGDIHIADVKLRLFPRAEKPAESRWMACVQAARIEAIANDFGLRAFEHGIDVVAQRQVAKSVAMKL
jgi:hypothetical protein